MELGGGSRPHPGGGLGPKEKLCEDHCRLETHEQKDTIVLENVGPSRLKDFQKEACLMRKGDYRSPLPGSLLCLGNPRDGNLGEQGYTSGWEGGKVELLNSEL